MREPFNDDTVKRIANGATRTANTIPESAVSIVPTSSTENRSSSSTATLRPPQGADVSNVSFAVDRSLNHASEHGSSPVVEDISNNVEPSTASNNNEVDNPRNSRPNYIHNNNNNNHKNSDNINNNSGAAIERVGHQDEGGGGMSWFVCNTHLTLANPLCFYRFEHRSHCRYFAFVCSDPSGTVSTTMVLSTQTSASQVTVEYSRDTREHRVSARDTSRSCLRSVSKP